VGTRVLPGRAIANLLIVFGIGEAFLRDFPVSGFSDVTDR
jgi:hypothetical protein